LLALFPQLPAASFAVEAETLADVVRTLERMAQGIGFYICDERGRLRQHVNIFVDGEMLVDRKALSDSLTASSQVFIVQALSGG
jgi:molybdopterin synthase sulfur carrier subunit